MPTPMSTTGAITVQTDGPDRTDGIGSRPVTTAVLGLGYVGTPTAISLVRAGHRVIGVDVSDERLAAVRSGDVDLPLPEREQLVSSLSRRALRVTGDGAAVAGADVVVICVPTPVDVHLTPDLGPLRAACRTVVSHARSGQTIILASTTYVGSTRELLAEPLASRQLRAGREVFVAFSPERINPGGPSPLAEDVPRVVGGVTDACTEAAARVVADLTSSVVRVSSPETAEMTKLVENSFRAVNIALANEFAEIARSMALDPTEVVDAAATKPYGFMPFHPGPGAGGHCIPCDPHYLLWQLRAERRRPPLIELAMNLLADRPHHVVTRARDVLASARKPLAGAKVLIVGLTYKSGVADVRESPMLRVAALLRKSGAHVDGTDPLVDDEVLDTDGQLIHHVPFTALGAYDLVILATWQFPEAEVLLRDARLVLDATYRSGLPGAHAL